jgi:hypothetical protein
MSAITSSRTINVSNPAEDTAAAVSCPEIAEAMESPARTSMITNRIIIPRGVFMMFMIVPVVPDAPLPNVLLPSYG